jgi:hypothetical protein
MCNRWTIRKRLKKQKKKGEKLIVDLVKLVEIAISPVLRKGLVELHTRPTGTMFSTGDRMPFRFAYLTRVPVA